MRKRHSHQCLDRLKREPTDFFRDLSPWMRHGSSTTRQKLKSSRRNAVVALLEEMCLQKYIEKFRSQEIDLEAFRHLTESDLDELGVLSLQPRQSLLALIRQLRPKV
ncbi:BICC1 [Cordylochernes scorpioides]|uniref:BICC1 n=1 Tax=Cordylochernes scorpioides TaxID=51811 RepID=A0ABY6KCW2_9ARAC|nr:BICC1 [Cordylochernes scorpioides]